MKERTCCFTGHRQIDPRKYGLVMSALETKLKELIQNGYSTFATGGALGFDTLAAQTVLKLKKEYPNIRLHLILPCLSQTRGWPASGVLEYERIKAAADEVTYTSQAYFNGCMQKRNRALVDISSICIAFMQKQTGGTAYTVRYAYNIGVPVINIADMIWP